MKCLYIVFKEIETPFVIILAIGMILMCTWCVWALFDEVGAVNLFFRGAVTRPIFVGDWAWFKWIGILPMPFAIPWIIYRIKQIAKGATQ
jgi:hypothetical protein